MRLLHFNHAFFTRSETFVKGFVEKSLFCSTPTVAGYCIEDIPEYFVSNLDIRGLPALSYKRKNLKGATKFVRDAIRGSSDFERAVISILREINPDAVHCHFGVNGVLFNQISKKFDLSYPFVTTFYGYDASSLPKEDTIYAKNLNSLWKNGAAFLAEGPALAQRLVDLGADSRKVKVNPLLINLRHYPIKKKYRNAQDPIRFLMVGRFVEKKGFHLFLELLGSIKDLLPRFEVNMIGYGSLEEQYRNIIKRCYLSDYVNILGGKDHGEVINALFEHDFFVHPSYTAQNGDSEGGAPTILIEAQAVGIPIITSDHADIPYIMGYHNFLAKENDLFSLREYVLKSITYSDWPSLAKVGRNKVLSQHDLQTSTVYPSILNGICSR